MKMHLLLVQPAAAASLRGALMQPAAAARQAAEARGTADAAVAHD